MAHLYIYKLASCAVVAPKEVADDKKKTKKKKYGSMKEKEV
jgi:hypothetical protein